MRWGATMLARLRLRLDAWRFAGTRADYFDYLQAVLLGAQGRLTVRELFDRDAARHGAGTVRGRLSWTWARACEASGGDLRMTWLGCFPAVGTQKSELSRPPHTGKTWPWSPFLVVG